MKKSYIMERNDLQDISLTEKNNRENSMCVWYVKKEKRIGGCILVCEGHISGKLHKKLTMLVTFGKGSKVAGVGWEGRVLVIIFLFLDFQSY